MTGLVLDERSRGRRPFRILAAVFASIVVAAGLTAVVVASNTKPASAATVSFSQCNNRGPGPGGAALSVTCSVNIINTIDASGGTSSVVYLRNCTLNACTGDTASSTDVINAVHQCNDSDIDGDSTTICSVNIVNNISASAPAAATALTLNQCIGSGNGGGTLMTGCIPSSSGSATVTQCNRSGVGGGGAMTCNASGTISASFPVTVDQCNDSETGGGSFVTCTTRITTNVVDTDVVAPAPSTTAPGGPNSGTPTGTPTVGTPEADTPGTPATGTPQGPSVPPVVAPPNLTG